MDVVDFAKHMYKVLQEREQDIASALAGDACKDWEHYKLMVGEGQDAVPGLQESEQMIEPLLERTVDDDEDFIST